MLHVFCPQTDMDLSAGLSVYVHIPFCSHKCYFCDFFSVQGWSEYQRGKIIAQILTHLKQSLSALSIEKIETFYLGGGTPSLLSCAELAAFLDVARQYHAQEITVEANPESLTQDWIHEVFSRSQTRLSLGVQSFLIKDLHSLGRFVSEKQLMQSFDWLAPYHQRINLDLLAGLKHQTWGVLQQELQTLLNFHPGHISFYMLTVEEGTALMRRQHLVAKEERRSDLWLWGREMLHRHGYLDYEISNFTQKFPCQHNMRYWDLHPYLGIGPGAVSNIPLDNGQALRIQGLQKLPLWGNAATPYTDLYTVQSICAEEFLFEHFMMGWRTRQGINLHHLYTRFKDLGQNLLTSITQDKTIPCIEKEGYLRLKETERLNLNRHLLHIMEIQERLILQANK